MPLKPKLLWFSFPLILYVAFCSIAGTFLADAALHPVRRPLPDDLSAEFRQSLVRAGGSIEEVSITTPDSVVLRGWLVRPLRTNGNAAIVLHGLADNRLGMSAYALLLLDHGFAVLLPDARAHGASGGELATYGLLERNDIRQWVDFVRRRAGPGCIYGLGESMGAASLLQSLAAGADFCAVIAESPFSNFREIAYDRMGQPFHLGAWVGRTILRPVVDVAFLRAHWKYGLNMEQVSPEDAVSESRIPVLLIHGKIDGNIPLRHSERIHARAPGADLWEVPGADHCGALSVEPEEFRVRLLAWFRINPAVQHAFSRCGAAM